MESIPGLARLDHLHEVAQTLLTDDLVGWQRGAVSRAARVVRLQLAVAEAAAEAEDTLRLLRSACDARNHWFFKTVAKVDGRYLSIFDGQTEFIIGERIERQQALGHRGAFFAYDNIERARAASASFPKCSKLLKAERALLRVGGEVSHSEARCAHGKAMLWAMTPLEEVPMKAATTGRRRRAPPPPATSEGGRARHPVVPHRGRRRAIPTREHRVLPRA